MSRFCLHRFRKQNCKARDPISRRTVTFGETAHKRYTPCRTCGWQRRRRYCNAWQGCFANSLPTVCRLCRKQMFSFFCMQTRRVYSVLFLWSQALGPPPPRPLPLPSTVPPPPTSDPPPELTALSDFTNYGPDYLEFNKGASFWKTQQTQKA